jgi:hypothetical protein
VRDPADQAVDAQPPEVGLRRALDERARLKSGGRVNVTVSAAGLLTVAVRLLPSADRVRYREEFGSEFREIAYGGVTWRVQLAYAARQVLSACQLRRELWGPQRHGAVR